jgi:hypothetical protein
VRRRISHIAGLICLLSLAGLAALLLGGASAAPAPCGVATGLGGYDSTHQPGACWRPYADTSPFNRPVPPETPTASDSAANVFRLLVQGPTEPWILGDPKHDYGVPIYWSRSTDPLYTLHCTKPWGRCALEGLRIRVPAQAMPAGGYATPGNDHDAHLTVIDQATGWEYDLWNVSSKTATTINFGWGGKTRIDGDGLGSGAVAAAYGSIGGPIRERELAGNFINHALTLGVPCSNSHVYPATDDAESCAAAGLPAGYSIPLGTHYVLNMTAAEIDALTLPTWKKTVLHALATYGAYVSDTSGIRNDWGFEIESRQTYTSFGQADPWVTWAKSQGVSGYDSDGNGYPEYLVDVNSGMPWSKLRVVGTCAAAGTCFPPSSTVHPLAANLAGASSQAAQRAGRCRQHRAAWARRYRRRHDRVGPAYQQKLRRWGRRCAALAASGR